MGRGGTNLGFADNGAIIYDNPGALVNAAGNGLVDLEVDTVIPQLHYTDAKPNDARSHTRPLPTPQLAVIRRSRDGNWAWGLGVFTPAGFGAAYDFQNSFAGPQLYKSTAAVGKVLPALSYRITDRLSIGGTAGLAMSYLDLQGPVFLQSGALRGAPLVLDLQNFGVAPTGSVGLQYRLTQKTTLGLTYITETQFKMGGSMDANVYGLGPTPLYSRFSATTNIKWPRSLGAGFSHKINQRNIVGLDVIYYDWHHAFDQINVNLTNPSNPLVPVLAGTAIPQHLAMNWRDTVSLRLGYQWAPCACSTFRFGYVYHASPAPNNTLMPYTDGVLVNAFSLGYSRKIGRAYLNGAYQYSFGPTRRVGASSLAGGDFSNSTLRAQLHVASLGVLLPF